MNRSQPLSLLESEKSTNKPKSPKEVLLEHQLNWAVNQTQFGKIGGIEENIGGMEELDGWNWEHMLGAGARRQKRVKRSPRGPPYWLNPANNLVVDDPPPPEVSAPQYYSDSFLTAN